MTVDEKLNEIFKIYQKVSLLSDKNGCKVIRIRHKKLEKDLVLHILPKRSDVYEALCGIRQKNLIKIYETFGFSDGMIVLEEYIDGLSVYDIAQTGKYRKKGAVKIIKELCNALKVLHNNGIVHRDIKPENVMIDKDGRVVLIDFNASRHISANKKDTVIMGTVGYAAPEQLGLAQSDARTDIYALGILFNVLLTGYHPNEQIAKGRCGRIIRKCININLSERYQSVDKLKSALSVF